MEVYGAAVQTHRGLQHEQWAFHRDGERQNHQSQDNLEKRNEFRL